MNMLPDYQRYGKISTIINIINVVSIVAGHLQNFSFSVMS